MGQIIAMGGGGFSMEPDNPLLDRYALEQTRKECPKVCFLPTASGDADNYVVNFYGAFNKFNCRPSHLSLFRLPEDDVETSILEKDIIYVGGGNTKSMLALWRAWDLGCTLRKAYQKGTVLAGISAGAICWFEQGLSDSIPGQQTVLRGLGFLSGSCCPHYDSQEARRPAYHRLLLAGEILPGYALEDGAALHFVDGELTRIVTSRPEAKAYRLEKMAGTVEERPLQSTYLGTP